MHRAYPRIEVATLANVSDRTIARHTQMGLLPGPDFQVGLSECYSEDAKDHIVNFYAQRKQKHA